MHYDAPMYVENGISYWWNAEKQIWEPDWNDLRRYGMINNFDDNINNKRI